LLFMAICEIEGIQLREKILPIVNFSIEVFKTILDVIRQNSKLLDLYNTTAITCFDYIQRLRAKKLYKKISDTLHSHFKQILDSSKVLPDANKIPFPVDLNEDETLKKVLSMRTRQLEYGLNLEEWQDAFRTSESVYSLVNKQSSQINKIKPILQDFYKKLGIIFWQNKFQLFYAYAFFNFQTILKQNKTTTAEEKLKVSQEFILACLSIPLCNHISNFERLT